jgi:hypothetical protein
VRLSCGRRPRPWSAGRGPPDLENFTGAPDERAVSLPSDTHQEKLGADFERCRRSLAPDSPEGDFLSIQ